MADDLADFPIVVLENDFPEQVGKIGLFDIQMPLGNTGILFVAAVSGVLMPLGVIFTPLVTYRSYLAASTAIIRMGLIRGESFEFLRTTLSLSQSDIAVLYGVDQAAVVAWEANVVPVPWSVWSCLSYRVALADGVALPSHGTIDPPSWRPRLIRVFPNIPMISQEQTGEPAYHAPCPILPGAECYPPFRPL